MADRLADLDRTGSALVLSFPYNPALVNDCRQMGGRFTRNPNPAWLWPIPTPGAAGLAAWLDRHTFTVTAAARASLAASIDRGIPPPTPPKSSPAQVASIDLSASGAYWTVCLAPGRHFRAALEMIKGLPQPQRSWNAELTAWDVRVSGPSILVIAKLRALGYPLSTEAAAAFARLTENTPTTATPGRDDPPPWPDYQPPPNDLDGLADMTSASGHRLRPFQRRGIARAATWKRSINAFQVGLGKTITALATARYLDAFPLVIICQASKKLDWLEEANEWIPGRSVILIEGRGAAIPAGADIYIVNYDILADSPAGGVGRAVPLAAIKPSMVVADESQLIKERSAARTKAAIDLIKSAPYRLLLSGTAVKSRPGELITQLQAIGALKDFGGLAAFRRRYCAMTTRTVKGRNVSSESNGARNAIELHERLSSRWYFRLTKAEVLPELPPIRRHVVPLDIDNSAEYQHAQTSFLRWIYETSLSDAEFAASLPPTLTDSERADAMRTFATDKAERASRAAQIMRINALKRIAARGMISRVISWTDDYLASGSKLILFAHHKDIQRQLFAAFPGSARLSADDSDTDQHVYKHRFQTDPDCRLMIVSMGVGATGHTLTAADACAFVELAWTPADHDQGEGRAYGRMNDPHGLDSYFLIADGTIYEDILELLDAKRSTVDAILDGLAPEGTDNILGDLMSRLRSAAVHSIQPAERIPAPPPRQAPPALISATPAQPALFDLAHDPGPSPWTD